jgi:hypothetical protein
MGGVPDAVAEPAGREEPAGKAITARAAISWSAEATSEPARLAAPTTPRPASGMPLWPPPVQRAPGDQHQRGEGQVVGVHHPPQVAGGRAELADQGGQRHVHDGDVQADDQRRPPPPDTAPAPDGSVDRQAEDTARHNESLINLSHRG